MEMKKGRYWVKFNMIEAPFEDLFYMSNQSQDGYILSYAEHPNVFNVLVARKDGEKKVYTVGCPVCGTARDAKFVRRQGEVVAIACASCGRSVIQRVNPRPRRKLPGRESFSVHAQGPVAEGP